MTAIKDDILSLSPSDRGQGDPDSIRQRALDAVVVALLAVSPQPPVKARRKRLEDPWHQIWGPYGDRKDDRADEFICIMTRPGLAVGRQ